MRRRVYLYCLSVRKLGLVALLIAPLLHAQFSQRPPDAVVPVAGSTRGAAGSNFKTELQMTNPAETKMEGWFVLQPGMTARRYELNPGATLSFDDVVAELGASGLVSIDILAERGPVPTIVARAYDDQPTGTTGVSVPAIRAAEVLTSGSIAALIVPRDLERYRFNIGARALTTGATLELTVRDSAGVDRHFADIVLGENQFTQQPGDVFAGTTLRANDSIEVKIAAGSAIVYATTVDNRTNDSSIQVLRK
jgi:hypothetical protein